MKVLLLVTRGYPYGDGETFLHDELPYLSNAFDRVVIVPMEYDFPGGAMRSTPENCLVVDSPTKAGLLPPVAWAPYSIAVLSDLRNTDIWRFPFRWLRKVARFIGRGGAMYSRMCKAWELCDSVGDVVIYHYWKDSSVFFSRFMVRKFNGTFRVVSRAHRFDLYQESGVLLFRRSMVSWIDAVYSVSSDGVKHLVQKQGYDGSLVSMRNLGVQVPCQFAPIPKALPLVIVALSNLVPVKNLHLLVCALDRLNLRVDCHIIGSGPCYGSLVDQARGLNADAKVIFHGHLEHPDVQDFFRSVPVHLLVNVSESEGVPVSMMEAMSYGIPVLATNVGGVSELVDNSVGWLLGANPRSSDVADKLSEIACLATHDPQLDGRRSRARLRIESHYSAAVQYSRHANDLANLAECIQL